MTRGLKMRNKIKTFLNNKITILTLSVALSFGLSSGAQSAGILPIYDITNPFTDMDVEIVKPSGNIIDDKYGVLLHNSGTQLNIKNTDEKQSLPVVSPLAGKVIYIDDKNETYGTVLKIVHYKPYSVSTFYGLDVKTMPQFEQEISRGETIGSPLSSNVYFEHVLESGYSLAYKKHDTFRTSVPLRDQQMAIGQNYFDKSLALNTGAYAFDWGSIWGGGDDTEPEPILGGDLDGGTPLPIGIGTPIPGSGTPGGVGTGTGTGIGGSGSGGSGTPADLVGGGDSVHTTTSSGSYVAGGPTSAAGGSYADYSDLSGTEVVDALATNPGDLCDVKIESDSVLAAENTMKVKNEIRNAANPAPPTGIINEMSCFDQFSTIMSTVVAEAGITGSFDIFGFGVDAGTLVGMGMDALSSGACDKANDIMASIKDRGVDINLMYAGHDTMVEIEGNYSGYSYDTGTVQPFLFGE